MRPPDESNGDEIAARRLFARLDEALRAAGRGRWATAKRTRNDALLRHIDSEDGRADRQPPSGESMEGDGSVAPGRRTTSSDQEEDSSG
jgi:hypothetical protein